LSVKWTRKNDLHDQIKVSTAEINWLMMFKEIIPVYSDNHTRPKIQNEELIIVEAGGTYSHHWVLKD
jgi:hypothetical protein